MPTEDEVQVAARLNAALFQNPNATGFQIILPEGNNGVPPGQVRFAVQQDNGRPPINVDMSEATFASVAQGLRHTSMDTMMAIVRPTLRAHHIFEDMLEMIPRAEHQLQVRHTAAAATTTGRLVPTASTSPGVMLPSVAEGINENASAQGTMPAGSGLVSR